MLTMLFRYFRSLLATFVLIRRVGEGAETKRALAMSPLEMPLSNNGGNRDLKSSPLILLEAKREEMRNNNVT